MAADEVETALELIEAAKKNGWIEFRADMVVLPQLGRIGREEEVYRVKRVLAAIQGVAHDMGLDFFSYVDQQTRENVFRVETRAYQEQKRAELQADIARMKLLRWKIGVDHGEHRVTQDARR